MPLLVVLGGEFFKKGEVKTLYGSSYWVRAMILLAVMLYVAAVVGPPSALLVLLLPLVTQPRAHTVGTVYRARDQTAGTAGRRHGSMEKKWRRALACRIIRASAFTAYRVRDQPATGLRPQMPVLTGARIAKRQSTGMASPQRKVIAPGVVPRTAVVTA